MTDALIQKSNDLLIKLTQITNARTKSKALIGWSDFCFSGMALGVTLVSAITAALNEKDEYQDGQPHIQSALYGLYWYFASRSLRGIVDGFYTTSVSIDGFFTTHTFNCLDLKTQEEVLALIDKFHENGIYPNAPEENTPVSSVINAIADSATSLANRNVNRPRIQRPTLLPDPSELDFPVIFTPPYIHAYYALAAVHTVLVIFACAHYDKYKDNENAKDVKFADDVCHKSGPFVPIELGAPIVYGAGNCLKATTQFLTVATRECVSSAVSSITNCFTTIWNREIRATQSMSEMELMQPVIVAAPVEEEPALSNRRSSISLV